MTIQFTVIIISMAALPLIGVVCFHKAMIKKRLEGRPGAADSSMRHALWTFFHLKRPIRPADLPAHHMPIRSRAQTNTPRTLLSSCTLWRQSSKLFLKWYSTQIYLLSVKHSHSVDSKGACEGLVVYNLVWSGNFAYQLYKSSVGRYSN